VSKQEKIKSTYNKFFIAFIVLVFIVCLTIALYYSVTSRRENDQITFLLISLFLTSFIGGMVFIPVHLEFLKDRDYTFSTAISNYFLMLIEGTIMLLGFSLSETPAGRYSQWFLIIVFLFFGMHLFSYPRTFKNSLLALLPHIMFVVLNLIGVKGGSIESIVNLLAKQGYVFALSLIIAGFLMFFMPWFWIRRESSKKDISKILTIYSILYAIFVLIPGLLYLMPGLGNYFEVNSTRLLVLSVLYFIYILIEKIRELTEGLINFITEK